MTITLVMLTIEFSSSHFVSFLWVALLMAWFQCMVYLPNPTLSMLCDVRCLTGTCQWVSRTQRTSVAGHASCDEVGHVLVTGRSDTGAYNMSDLIDNPTSLIYFSLRFCPPFHSPQSTSVGCLWPLCRHSTALIHLVIVYELQTLLCRPQMHVPFPQESEFSIASYTSLTCRHINLYVYIHLNSLPDTLNTALFVYANSPPPSASLHGSQASWYGSDQRR